MKTTKQYGKKADEALSLLVKLVRASDTVSALTARDIARYGLTVAQFGVLETLGHLGPMKVGEICGKKLSSGGNMTVVIDNLEKTNLVERVRVADDRRAYMIQLTPKGQKLFDTIFKQHAQFVANIMSVLSSHEINQLSMLLKKLGLTLKKKLQNDKENT